MKYLIWFLRRLFCKHEYKICLYFPEAGNITWKAPCQERRGGGIPKGGRKTMKRDGTIYVNGKKNIISAEEENEISC